MLQFFRSLLHSRIGALIGIGVLVIIALAFAAGDIGNLRNGASGSSGGALAKVGDEEVTSAELNREANDAVQRVRQSEPSMTMKSFIGQGGLNVVLNDLIDLAALSAFGHDNGIVAGDRLIDSELQRAGITAGQGISRDSVAQRLIARQILSPAEFGAIVPGDLAWRYTQLLAEQRTGSIVALPSLAFAPEKEPSTAELSTFYKAHTGMFVRPERRVVRYATFGDDAVKNVPAPTDAEIAARYKADAAQYASVERRRLTQLIVPTEAAAKAIIAEVQGGKSLEAAATEEGLSAANLDPIAKGDLAAQSSAAVADAAFAASSGQLAAIARSPLGFHVIKVDAVENRPGRTLDQVKGEIATALATEKRRAALSQFLNTVAEKFENGANLPEVAKGLNIAVKQSPALTADGAVYGQAGATADPVLKPVLKTAFSMQEGEPQVAEAEPGKTFILYDVTEIAQAAPAPFNEIVNDVKFAYALDKGSQSAKEQAQQVQAAVRKGEGLEAVLARLGKKLPPVQRVGMTRAQLTQLQRAGREIPPPIRLLFAMASGTVKVQEAPQRRGWFVVVLDKIQPGQVQRNDSTVKVAQRDLGKVAGDEYSGALRKAITKEVGVKRNDAALKALHDELAGVPAPTS